MVATYQMTHLNHLLNRTNSESKQDRRLLKECMMLQEKSPNSNSRPHTNLLRQNPSLQRSSIWNNDQQHLISHLCPTPHR